MYQTLLLSSEQEQPPSVHCFMSSMCPIDAYNIQDAIIKKTCFLSGQDTSVAEVIMPVILI